jgi:hypothetical protein
MKFPTTPELHWPYCSASLLLSQYLCFNMAIFNLRQVPQRNCVDDLRRFSLSRQFSGKLFNSCQHAVAQGRTIEETRKSQNWSPESKLQWIWLSLMGECVFLLVLTILIMYQQTNGAKDDGSQGWK